MRANAYHEKDADHEWIVNQQELDDARADAHRELAAEDPVNEKCPTWCLCKDVYGFCGERFPQCELMRDLGRG